jgi:exodeoxyribonuclease VII small subunit
MTHNESTTLDFKQSYAVLQRHAVALRKQSNEPNIDDLLAIVQDSMHAYEVCQTRINAVEKALNHVLGQSQAEPGSEGAACEVPVSPATKLTVSQPANPETFAISVPELVMPRVSRAERFSTQPR